MKIVERIVIGIVLIIAFLILARGHDGFICNHIYPSAYTEAEKAFWNAIGGCNRSYSMC